MNKKISVCMATYNGAQFIEAQMDSILSQLGSEDEVLVMDDHSSDDTCHLIEQYADNRIKLVRNPHNVGHVQNFAKAIALATGDYIFLADQDDVWMQSRVRIMLDRIDQQPRNTLVIGDFLEISAAGEMLNEDRPLGDAPLNRWVGLKNIFLGRAKYFGCTFLFRSDLKSLILPVPQQIESHDIWIALNACAHGKLVHCKQPTLLRRIHGNNLTPRRRRSLYKIGKSRLTYLWYLTSRWFN